MSDIHFQGFWRMDWGLGNPNKTAALIATLMVAVWALAYIRRWGFWAALVLFTGLGICLIHTFSRGGLIACLAGMIPVVAFAPRPWPKGQLIAAIASVWIIVGASVYLQAHHRLTQGVVQEDRSISNRWEIWKVAPTMMRDAPGGWGIGNSGHAFMEWYQPVDREETYRTLVNSHLTWMVEMNWLGRLGYVAAWGLVFLICWPGAWWARSLSVAFGIWLSFFVASFFSSVAESPWLWIVPAVGLVAACAIRLRSSMWPVPHWWLVPPVLASAVCLSLALLPSRSLIHRTGEGIVVGEGPSGTWILVDHKILGAHAGKSLRRNFENVSGGVVALAESAELLPASGIKTLILTGSAGADHAELLEASIKTAGNVVLVNPGLFPQQLRLPPGDLAKVSVVLGEFSQAPAGSAWGEVAKTEWLAGVGDFLPDWPTKLLRRKD